MLLSGFCRTVVLSPHALRMKIEVIPIQRTNREDETGLIMVYVCTFSQDEFFPGGAHSDFCDGDLPWLIDGMDDLVRQAVGGPD